MILLYEPAPCNCHCITYLGDDNKYYYLERKTDILYNKFCTDESRIIVKGKFGLAKMINDKLEVFRILEQ